MRAWLSWDLLRKPDTQITEIYSRSRDDLANLHTVWYATPEGANGDWRNASDRPLRVSEAAQTFNDWPSERAPHINFFQTQFERYGYPIQLTLPAYSPNGHDTIILDGTHRAVAAHLAQKDVRLIIFALQGPCDPDILPDLMHYSSRFSSSSLSSAISGYPTAARRIE